MPSPARAARAPRLTLDEIIAAADELALYQIEYSDGTVIGVGSMDEVASLQAEGVFRCEASDLRMVRIA